VNFSFKVFDERQLNVRRHARAPVVTLCFGLKMLPRVRFWANRRTRRAVSMPGLELVKPPLVFRLEQG
jgi:hypothetical protein